jgi:hypothetical protein
MRKSFKVATVFTGAAAAAAVFAPAAGAATATADAVRYNCPIGPRTAATVLYWPTSKHHGPTCVSSIGLISVGDTYFSYFCAGNYFGVINFPDRVSRYYKPGEGYGTLKDKVTSVNITGWNSGTYETCTT